MDYQKYLTNYIHLVILASLSLGLFVMSFAYLQTELLTNLYLERIPNARNLCLERRNESLKYVKVIDYQGYRRNSRLFCIYTNSENNLQLDISLQNGIWQTYSARFLNTNRHLYWPIYK